jgi:hypothetical protein
VQCGRAPIVYTRAMASLWSLLWIMDHELSIVDCMCDLVLSIIVRKLNCYLGAACVRENSV